MKKIALLIVFSLLSGCGSRLTLVDRKDGSIHTGRTEGVGGSGEGIVMIGNSEYRGPGIYQQTGGSYSIGNFNSSSTTITQRGMTTRSSFGTATNLAVPFEGKGLITMRSDGGKILRCVFSFNEFSNTGVGECSRNDGREYDLMMKK